MQISRVSADSLFHFTDSLERLVGILEHTFIPRYCWEHISTLDPAPDVDHPSIAIPMVCFCDLPLSQVRDHIEMYGNYGIGLKKEWGIRNGMNPIAYTIPKSSLVNGLRKNIDFLAKANIPTPVDPSQQKLLLDAYKGIVEFGLYTKLYKGRFYRKGSFLKEEVLFYNEREWRFVPSVTELNISGLEASLTWNRHVDDAGILNRWNTILNSGYRLRFIPDDIKYLIVRQEDEILSLANALQSIKSNFSQEQRTLLTSRIISVEQISADF